MVMSVFFFFSSRRRHTRCSRDWSSDVCSSDLTRFGDRLEELHCFGAAWRGSCSRAEVRGTNYPVLLDTTGFELPRRSRRSAFVRNRSAESPPPSAGGLRRLQNRCSGVSTLFLGRRARSEAYNPQKLRCHPGDPSSGGGQTRSSGRTSVWA